MTVHRYFLFVLLLTGLLAAGCGYHNPYTTGGTDGPTVTLFAPMWTNQTNELGLESIFYQTFNDWLRKSRRIIITDDPEQADLLLKGAILSINSPALTHDKYDQAVELQAILHLSCTLEDAKSSAVVWQDRDMVREEAFFVDEDALRTQKNREGALKIIAEDMAEDIYLRLHNTIIDTRQKNR